MTYRRGDKIRTVLPGITLHYLPHSSYQYHTRFFSFFPSQQVGSPTNFTFTHTRKSNLRPSVSQRSPRVHHIPVAHQRGFSEGQQLTTGRNTGVCRVTRTGRKAPSRKTIPKYPSTWVAGAPLCRCPKNTQDAGPRTAPARACSHWHEHR